MPSNYNNRKVTPGSGTFVNPSLSVALRHDYEALYNDVHQANALATDFQKHEAGKTSEIAVLKKVFENAQADLARLCASIAELRQERHQLANEAMLAMALERKVGDLTSERDRLRAEADAMRRALAGSQEEMVRQKLASDTQITRMAREMDALRHGQPTATASADPDIHTALTQISAALARLTAIVEKPPDGPALARLPVPPDPSAPSEDTIDIQFDV